MAQYLGVCRLIYNLALDIKRQAYGKLGKSVSKSALQLQVKELAREFPWINAVHSQVRQDPLIRLEKSYSNFFKGAGFPKFAKRDRYRSFTFPQGVKLKDGKLAFPKLGSLAFIAGKRQLGSIRVIRQATIKREIKGWFVSVLFEQDLYYLKKNNNRVGIDIGVAAFAGTSDGELIANPKHFEAYKRQLRIAQRRLARRKKGSRRRRKAVGQLQLIHNKIKNVRKDFLHKLSTKLISENQVIAVEKLKLSNMTRSARGTLSEPGRNVKQKGGLNRSLLDLGTYAFLQMLEYKALWYGRTLVRVDPKYTSQICSMCGHKDKENRKGQARFACLACGYENNADINAAINILGRGNEILALQEPGRNGPAGDISGITCEPEKKLHLKPLA